MTDAPHPTTDADALVGATESARGYLSAAHEYLAHHNPAFLEAYNAFVGRALGHRDALPDGSALSAKHREFVALGILCFRGAANESIVGHMRRALDLGATRQELLEVLEAAAVPGGGTTMMNGVRALMEVPNDLDLRRARPVERHRVGKGAFEHVALVVQEEQWNAAIDFYTSVLGLEQVAGGPDQTHIFFAGRDSPTAIELLRRQEPSPLGPPGHIAFVTIGDEWNDLCQTLERNGIAITRFKEHTDGHLSGNITDPAGNYLQILRRIEPVGARRLRV